MSSKRIGNQKPTVSVEPRRQYSDGDDCAELASAYGLTPDAWQKTILDAWLGRDVKDRFTATRCGLSVPRQNGKNAILEMFELYHLVVIGSAILHTAHEVKTARKSFLRLAGFFTDPRYPELQDMVVQIRRTNGQEAIVLTNGASIEFSARSRGAGRGFTVDAVVFDEAAFLTDEQLEAIMSTMAAAPLGNRQLVFTGTPPLPALPCEVFAKVRADALGKKDKRLAWHEWSTKEIPQASEFSEVIDVCYETNPALGIRLDETFTETEFNSLSDDGFARERLGYWAPDISDSNRLIKASEWTKLAIVETPDDEPPNKKAFGIKFTADGSKVAIAVAIKLPDGSVHVEIVNNGYRLLTTGTRAISEWLDERKSKTAAVAIDGMSNANALLEQLSSIGYPKRAILVPGTKGVIAASSMLLDAIHEQTLSNWVDDSTLLNSATTSTKREIGNKGGWGFGGDDSAPIEAASLALWAVKTTRRKPGRKAVVF